MSDIPEKAQLKSDIEGSKIESIPNPSKSIIGPKAILFQSEAQSSTGIVFTFTWKLLVVVPTGAIQATFHSTQRRWLLEPAHYPAYRIRKSGTVEFTSPRWKSVWKIVVRWLGENKTVFLSCADRTTDHVLDVAWSWELSRLMTAKCSALRLRECKPRWHESLA